MLSDLETGREIARHGVSQGKGEVIRNNDHYRDKQLRITELEASISQRLGADGSRLWPGSRQAYCPSSPVFREHAVALTAAMANRRRRTA